MSRFGMTDSRHSNTHTDNSVCSSCRAKNAAMGGKFGFVCNAGAGVSASAFLLIFSIVISIIALGGIIGIIIINSLIISIIKIITSKQTECASI